MTLKNITYSVPRTISQGENLITNPNDIATVFNNYFSSVESFFSIRRFRGASRLKNQYGIFF